MKKQHELQIESLKKETEEWKAKYLRALADYANAEKRVIGEVEAKLRFHKASFIKGFLEVLDHLEEASRHLKDEGLNIVVKEFHDLLEKLDIKEIEEVQPGKYFDPLKSECVDAVQVDKKDENKITEVLQKGYELGDIVIRPARVRVGKKLVDQKAEELAKEQLQKGDYM